MAYRERNHLDLQVHWLSSEQHAQDATGLGLPRVVLQQQADE